MGDNQQAITEDQRHRAVLIWDYHQMHHQTRPVDLAIGLGSHDLGVATHSVELYRAGDPEVKDQAKGYPVSLSGRAREADVVVARVREDRSGLSALSSMRWS